MTSRVRIILAALASILLGTLTAIGLALGSAAWRMPPQAESESLIGTLDTPFTESNGTQYLGSLILLQDARRWDQRAITCHYIPTKSWPPGPIKPTSSYGSKMDWFLHRRWPAERTIFAEHSSWQTIHQFGWPMHCLWNGRIYNQPGPNEPGWTQDGYGGIRVGSRPFPRVLPTLPMWGGLVVDCAVFALLWFRVLLVPGMVRRASRRCRGLCAACAYDLRATPAGAPCPECGLAQNPLPNAANTSTLPL